MATPHCRKLTYAVWVLDKQKNVSCNNINWQYFPCFVEVWDVLWSDNIWHGDYDWRTVILKIMFYHSLATHSRVSGLVVHTRRWVYDKITLHLLCYLVTARPVGGNDHNSAMSLFSISTCSKFWVIMKSQAFLQCDMVLPVSQTSAWNTGANSNLATMMWSYHNTDNFLYGRIYFLSMLSELRIQVSMAQGWF